MPAAAALAAPTASLHHAMSVGAVPPHSNHLGTCRCMPPAHPPCMLAGYKWGAVAMQGLGTSPHHCKIRIPLEKLAGVRPAHPCTQPTSRPLAQAPILAPSGATPLHLPVGTAGAAGGQISRTRALGDPARRGESDGAHAAGRDSVVRLLHWLSCVYCLLYIPKTVRHFSPNPHIRKVRDPHGWTAHVLGYP